MAVYLIGYDLHPSRGETYDELFAAIKQEANGWWHCLDSTWIIFSDGPSVAIRTRLQAHLKYDDDRLLVIQHQGGAAWVGFNQECSDWLAQHL